MVFTWLPPLLAKFSSAKILVLGDVMVDEYIWGRATRISPEAPVPIVHVQSRNYTAGGAANVAANIASLGGKPILCTVSGRDHWGATLKQHLKGVMGIDTSLIMEHCCRPTTVKSRLVAQNQHVVRIDTEVTFPLETDYEQQVIRMAKSVLNEVDGIAISDYNKGIVTDRVAREVVSSARSRGLPLTVDTKRTNFEVFRGAGIVTPNRLELEGLVHRTLKQEDELIAAAEEVRSRYDLSSVLVTRGEEGMTLINQHGSAQSYPAIAHDVADVTGAGDTVVASLMLVLSVGGSLAHAVLTSNMAASVVVTKRGTATCTVDEVLSVAQRLAEGRPDLLSIA